MTDTRPTPLSAIADCELWQYRRGGDSSATNSWDYALELAVRAYQDRSRKFKEAAA